MAQATEERKVNVGDARLWQSNGEFILVELRVVPRTRYGANIDQRGDAEMLEQRDQVGLRAR